MKDFKETLNIGKKGEKEICNYFVDRGNQMIDKSDDVDYQKIDVDFLLINKRNQKYKLEVKSDKRIHETNNLCIEIYNKRKTGIKRGWFYYCEADFICFYDHFSNDAYVLDWKKTKPLLDKIAKKKKFISYDNCESEVYLLSVDMAKKNKLVIHSFNTKKGGLILERTA